jgi:hypothetical protein
MESKDDKAAAYMSATGRQDNGSQAHPESALPSVAAKPGSSATSGEAICHEDGGKCGAGGYCVGCPLIDNARATALTPQAATTEQAGAVGVAVEWQNGSVDLVRGEPKAEVLADWQRRGAVVRTLVYASPAATTASASEIQRLMLELQNHRELAQHWKNMFMAGIQNRAPAPSREAAMPMRWEDRIAQHPDRTAAEYVDAAKDAEIADLRAALAGREAAALDERALMNAAGLLNRAANALRDPARFSCDADELDAAANPLYRAALAQPAAPVVDGELPPLPEPEQVWGRGYTSIQMREYGAACVAAARSARVGDDGLAERTEQKVMMRLHQRGLLNDLTQGAIRILACELRDDLERALRGYVPTPTAQPNIAAMVNRFLGWRLPKDFYPDCGITFKHNEAWGPYPNNWPIGTNLFTADQAKAMFEYVLSAAPSHPEPAGGNAAPPADDYAAFKATVDAEYPMPNSPHESVMQRAVDMRTAFRFGWNAGRRYMGGVQGDVRDALEAQMIAHRIAITPEYEGLWHAEIYGDEESPKARGEGKTPSEAVSNALRASTPADDSQPAVGQEGGAA